MSTTKPPGLTNFLPTMRDLEVLERFADRRLEAADLPDLMELCARAKAWRQSWFGTVPVNAEAPKEPA